MAAISFLACLGTVLLCYDLGAKLINRQSAFYAMLLFALSPGLWWTSIEPHPQIPSLFFAVLSLWCLARYLNTSTHPALIGASAISFGVAVAMKNDAVLLVPALFGLALFIRPAWRSCVICAGIVGASALVAYTLARVVLGAGTKALQAGQQTASSVLSVPGLTELLKQSTPIILGLGLLSAGLIAFSLFRLATGARQDRSWWLIIVSWSLPGYIFYLLVSGNNIRHVVAFGIPLFFIGAKYSKPRYIIACAVASFIIPANSNMVMYPSPNVPSSYGLFQGKMLKVQEVSRQLRHSDSCFVGSYTNDYIANDLLANGAVVVYQADVWDTKVVMQTPDGVRINLRRIDPTKRTMDPGSCRVLEYDSSGKKFHFLGSEWKLPIG
jgi:4-amino-4-deoxy-L-arabinose transferase-like glycosyltransferase